jgi:hypothetical protein
MTRSEIADLIERFLSGQVGDREWDDFTSFVLSDPIAENARSRCIATRDDAYDRQWCGPAGVEELRRIATELRRSHDYSALK